MKKVLIVEDNIRVANLIKSYLEKENYSTKTAHDGIKAMKVYSRFSPDLLILDLMLPGKSGREIAIEIRKDSTIPIIMVTAKSDEKDRLKGLNLGADDYVVKPFSPKELVARVGALFRRIDFDKELHSSESTYLEYKGLIMDPYKRKVLLKNESIVLTALQFDLLSIFAQSPGRVFSRKMLLEKLNSEEEIFERTIDAHIKNIRKALGETGNKKGLLKTVFGVGYKLE